MPDIHLIRGGPYIGCWIGCRGIQIERWKREVAVVVFWGPRREWSLRLAW